MTPSGGCCLSRPKKRQSYFNSKICSGVKSFKYSSRSSFGSCKNLSRFNFICFKIDKKSPLEVAPRFACLD